ncbi:SNF2-related protein [Desulfobacter latus]|uniref:Restriction endonuclease n=1 Tax=Desulfobacter latus TaxID=2292 RepID=A0A850TGR4_9BACT|nr:SNF2-related protein [Desulfobacter latus]NWH06736.1 restriction endonuclease [Desulfobacter latus]
MALQDLLKKYFTKTDSDVVFKVLPDSSGLNFILPKDEFAACKELKSNEWTQHQYMVLSMLQEEGIATEFPNGFSISSEDAVRLPEIREIFDLPPAFPGKFSIRVENRTTQSSFKVTLYLEYPNGQNTIYYELEGPYLKVGEFETYLPTPEQWAVIKSIQAHQKLPPLEKTEYNNLLLVHQLQQAKQAGASIDLSFFNKLKIINPESVSVSMRLTPNEDGVLNPSFGTEATFEKIETRLGQLTGNETVQSFKVGNEIILLDENKLAAAREIIQNRKISKSQVKDFVKTPSAFLDAALVDLDTGFSLRVKGATTFQHSYFGETDESGLNWFSNGTAGSVSCIEAGDLEKIIQDTETLEMFSKTFEDAQKHNAQEMMFLGKPIDITDVQAINEKVTAIREKIQKGEMPEVEMPVVESDDDVEQLWELDKDKSASVVVDIYKNYEILSYGSGYVAEAMGEVLYKDNLHLEDLKRQPFKHQEEGIRWLLGLSLNGLKQKQKVCGGLMADDMGLGKTYMALVGVYEFYKHLEQQNQEKKPVLVVAPLSLLENWKEEIDLTFKESPFKDVVILQSNADLKRFKIKGAGVETRQNKAAIESEDVPGNAIQYALKIGKQFAMDRLDQHQRLVLTTYQTLRDYQFSLCRIDWSFVIFDEAQNIKNPNALQTRAAKGLKSQFTLIVTGTPVENHLGDFWCLFDTAKPGLLGSYQDFRHRYIQPITKATSDKVAEVRAGVGRALREDVGALMIRRLKEDQLEGLPKKHIFVGMPSEELQNWEYSELLSSTMIGRQLAVYNGAVNGVIAAQENEYEKNPVLRGLHKLRDISLHPDLVDGGCLSLPDNEREALAYTQTAAKLETVFSLLHEIKKRQEKVILFVINKRLQRFLKLACHKILGEQVEIINGETLAVSKSPGQQTRKSIIDAFQNKIGFAVIIMSPLAAGVGLTVTGANNVIHVERHWNPAKEAQATDRVYRIGQEKDVNIYVPILHHPEMPSFDVNLHRLLSKKTNLKDAVVTPEDADLQNAGIFNTPGSEDRTIEEKYLKNMPWEHFEALVAELFARHYDAETYLTPQSNDRGCDVVVLSPKANMLIQCKHTTKHILSGEGPIRELLAAPSYYKEQIGKSFSRSIVITNAKSFSKPTRNAAQREGIELMGHTELSRMLAPSKITYSDIFKRLDKKRAG